MVYTWEVAKKACPSGWHLPTDSEWAMLVNQFGGTDMAGDPLKSVKSWNEDGNSTNSSGFDALAGGHRRPDGSYTTPGILGIFWTSLPNTVGMAWAWNFHYGGPVSSNKKNLKKRTVGIPQFRAVSQFDWSGIKPRLKLFVKTMLNSTYSIKTILYD